MDTSQDVSSTAIAAATEPLSQGVLWGQESIVSPEKVYTVTEDGYELVEQQPQEGHHAYYRVLFIGSGLLDQKDKVLKRIAEAVTQMYATDDNEHVYVIEADFTSDDGEALKTYLRRVSSSGSKVDLVVYLFDSHTDDDPLQHLVVLENHIPNALIWPLLTHDSVQQQNALSRHLGGYLNIRTVNVSGVHPERPQFASPHQTPQHDLALTVDQFTELRSKDIVRILKGWPAEGAYESHEEDIIVLPNSPLPPNGIECSKVLTGILSVAIVVGVWIFALQPQSVPVVEHHQALPTIQAELNPAWQVIDERTLQHPFEVRVDSGDKEDLSVMVQANGVDLEYPMVYEQGSEFKYVADVPSPCLLDSNQDIEATVVWRLDEGIDTKVIDQVVLSVDVCKPVQERQVREERKRSAVLAVNSLPVDIAWRLLIDKLLSKSHRVARTFVDVWHTLIGFWQRS